MHICLVGLKNRIFFTRGSNKIDFTFISKMHIYTINVYMHLHSEVSNVTKHYIINAFKQFNIGHIFRINLVNSMRKKQVSFCLY